LGCRAETLSSGSEEARLLLIIGMTPVDPPQRVVRDQALQRLVGGLARAEVEEISRRPDRSGGSGRGSRSGRRKGGESVTSEKSLQFSDKAETLHHCQSS
jgi:hypothetical protein